MEEEKPETVHDPLAAKPNHHTRRTLIIIGVMVVVIALGTAGSSVLAGSFGNSAKGHFCMLGLPLGPTFSTTPTEEELHAAWENVPGSEDGCAKSMTWSVEGSSREYIYDGHTSRPMAG